MCQTKAAYDVNVKFDTYGSRRSSMEIGRHMRRFPTLTGAMD
jgi:hypothetical protein